MPLTLELIPGSDLTLDTTSLTIVRKMRVKGLLPYTGGGDAFDHVASQVMGLVTVNYPHYVTPMGKLFWNSIQLHETNYAQLYEISVTYSPFDRQSGTYQITLDAGVGTTHVTAGTRLAGYAATADDVVDNGGLIGVDGDEVRGVDIDVEETSFSVQFRHPQSYLNWAYIDRICKLRGHPNADTFLRWQAGEVKFRGGQFTETNTEATAMYHFALSPNRTNIVIGGITVATKAGWDVLSPTYYPTTSVAGAKTHGVRKLKCVEVIRAPGGMDWKNYKTEFGWG